MIEWQQKANKLYRQYKFSDYQSALNFVNQISELANAANHHPDICFGWGYVNISLFTHHKNSITDLDHKLAKQINELEPGQ